MLCHILLFGALSCGLCGQAKERLSDYDIRYVDVNKERSLAKSYGVFGTPVVVVLKDGREIMRHYGVPDENFMKRLDKECRGR